jgi:threonine/homoserine/homoserine lactone efflux protein
VTVNRTACKRLLQFPPRVALFVAIAAVTHMAYALAAGAVAPALARSCGAQVLSRYLGGGALIGLGVFTALAEPRGEP